MKKSLIMIISIIFLFSILTGCSNDSSSNSETQKQNLEKLVVTYVTSPLNVPSIVEKEKQIFNEAFKDAGTTIEYAEITSGAEQTQALASGDVQILYGVGATSVILSAANGADIKVLNMYSRSPEAFTMYTKDKNITSPENLRGKTIAGPVGTNLHELLVSYLATANMTIDDVNYVNMSIPDAKAALDGGSIDVALLAGATAHTAKTQGYHMVTNGQDLIDAIIVVAVTNKFYQENKDVIDTFIKAQEKIATFIEQNTDEAMSIVAKTLDLDEMAVREMYILYNFSTDVTELDIAGFQKTADFMLESGMIENPVDVKSLFLNQ